MFIKMLEHEGKNDRYKLGMMELAFRVIIN